MIMSYVRDGKSCSALVVNAPVSTGVNITKSYSESMCAGLSGVFQTESLFVLSGLADVWRASITGFMMMKNTLPHA